MAVQTSAIADIIGTNVTHLSLHSTDGGATGSDELTGGSYVRQVPDYSGAAAGGTDDLASSVTFGGPGAAQVSRFGLAGTVTSGGGA